MTVHDYKEMIHSIVIPSGLSHEEQSKQYQPLTNFLQSETPSALYRFRHCNEHSISAFDQDQIWFSPGSEMNDVFDALLFIDKNIIQSDLNCFFGDFENKLRLLATSEGTLDKLLPHNLIAFAKVRLNELYTTNIDEFKQHFYNLLANSIHTDLPQIEHIIQSTIRFACFSESIDSAAMWGYYADAGKGFALAYDFRNQNYTDCSYCKKKAFCQSAKICSLFRVIYEDTPFDATEYGIWLLQNKIARGILSNIQFPNLSTILQQVLPCPDEFMYTKALLHKATSWSHEKEWRLTYSCGQQVDGQSKFICAKKRPSALYLGQYISPINEKILRHIAVEKNIPIYKMGMNNTQSSYKLVPVSI